MHELHKCLRCDTDIMEQDYEVRPFSLDLSTADLF